MDVTGPPAPPDGHAPHAAPLHPGRQRPAAAQLALVGGGAVLLGAWLLVPGLLGHRAPAAATPPPAAPHDGFTPTPEQWAGLRTAAVRSRAFAAWAVTDGRIAVDDDLSTPVYSPFTGRVTRLFVKAGDTVRAGQPLLGVQASEFVQAANDLVAARSTDRTTRAQLALAATTERRQHQLYLAQGGALKDWQQAQVDLATAQGAYSSAEVALGAVRDRLRILGKSASAIAAMETAPDPARFSPDAVVQAPISGTVISRQVGLGQNIATQGNGGQGPIFTIGDLSRVWLVANLREEDAPDIHLGDVTEVTVLAVPGRQFKARISFIAASIDPTIHRLPIHADIANPDGVLKPEMFASFRIASGQASAAPAVPAEAVVYDPDGAHVWLAGPDHTLAVRRVTLGRTDGGSIEVLSGLRAGDVVVTAGAVFIDRAAQSG